MDDRQIIELYWSRDEQAIAETDRKYGAYCRAIAMNLLGEHRDTEECVSDAYHQAWRSIPPQRPVSLRAWLGRVVRNFSLNRWKRDRAMKRGGGMECLLGELEECVPSPQTVERRLESEQLGAVISAWLRELPREDRVLFLRRYWYGEALKELARERGESAGRLAQRMYRLRAELRRALEKEGITL